MNLKNKKEFLKSIVFISVLTEVDMTIILKGQLDLKQNSTDGALASRKPDKRNVVETAAIPEFISVDGACLRISATPSDSQTRGKLPVYIVSDALVKHP